jgi:hypothetical protein
MNTRLSPQPLAPIDAVGELASRGSTRRDSRDWTDFKKWAATIVDEPATT